MGERINHFRELRVYQLALQTALDISKLTRIFPAHERYVLADQMKRSSRSICANLAESWRKRRYKAAFIAKLSDCEAEACEMQVWLEIAYQENYINEETFEENNAIYQHILAQLILMSQQADKWVLKKIPSAQNG